MSVGLAASIVSHNGLILYNSVQSSLQNYHRKKLYTPICISTVGIRGTDRELAYTHDRNAINIKEPY